VENVFQTIPQLSNIGSGVPTHSQHQTQDALGRQLQSGHRIPLNISSSSAPGASIAVGLGARSFFKNSRGTVAGSTATVYQPSARSRRIRIMRLPPRWNSYGTASIDTRQLVLSMAAATVPT
jgi:hypothetical protein